MDNQAHWWGGYKQKAKSTKYWPVSCISGWSPSNTEVLTVAEGKTDMGSVCMNYLLCVVSWVTVLKWWRWWVLNVFRERRCSFTQRFGLVLLYYCWLLTCPSGLTLGINHKHLCFLSRLVYMYMTQLVRRALGPTKTKEVYFGSSLVMRLLSFGHVPQFNHHLFRV